MEKVKFAEKKNRSNEDDVFTVRAVIQLPALSSLGLMKPLSLTSAFTIPPTAPLNMITPIGTNKIGRASCRERV